MLPIITMQFSAATDSRQLDIDEDCVLVGVVTSASSTGTAVISFDKTDTFANSVTAPGNELDNRLIGFARGFFLPLSVPLTKGSPLFVSINGAASVTFYFQLKTE